MMKAYALLGGPKDQWPSDLKKQLHAAKNTGDLIIGVDRGAILLQEMGIDVDLAVGDFDSLSAKELSELEAKARDIRYSNPIKDDTDSELMLKVAFSDYQVSELIICGATGGRIDHFLVNIFTFLNPEFLSILERVRIIDRQNKIIYLNPGKHIVEKVSEYRYFAVAALSSVKGLSIKDARYDLKDFDSEYIKVFSSNEFKEDRDNFSIEFNDGIVAIIFSKDVDRYQNIY